MSEPSEEWKIMNADSRTDRPSSADHDAAFTAAQEEHHDAVVALFDAERVHQSAVATADEALRPAKERAMLALRALHKATLERAGRRP